MAQYTNRPPTDMPRRWKRLQRHLRSCNESTRALRDAARALEPARAPRSCLCRHATARLEA